jgi:DNA-binding XRE family transcriptional regulator
MTSPSAEAIERDVADVQTQLAAQLKAHEAAQRTLSPTGWWPCERCGESPLARPCVLTRLGDYLCARCRGEFVAVPASRPRPRPVVVKADPDPKAVQVTAYIPLRIRTARQKADLTVAQLAKRVGVSCGAVARWESGQRRPDPALLGALAGAIGCPVGTFFGEDNRKIA